MEKECLEIEGLSLLEGERLDMTLNYQNGVSRYLPEKGEDALILTNKRVIQVAGGRRSKEATFAALKQIQSISVKRSSKKISTLIWGVLGALGGLAMYKVLQSSFENTTVSAVLGIVGSVLGAILIIDYVFSQDQAVVTLHLGDAQIQARVRGEDGAINAYTFINRVFEMNESEGIATEDQASLEEASPPTLESPPSAQSQPQLNESAPAAYGAEASGEDTASPADATQTDGLIIRPEQNDEREETVQISWQEPSPIEGSEPRPGPSQSDDPPPEDDTPPRQS